MKNIIILSITIFGIEANGMQRINNSNIKSTASAAASSSALTPNADLTNSRPILANFEIALTSSIDASFRNAANMHPSSSQNKGSINNNSIDIMKNRISLNIIYQEMQTAIASKISDETKDKINYKLTKYREFFLINKSIISSFIKKIDSNHQNDENELSDRFMQSCIEHEAQNVSNETLEHIQEELFFPFV